jgi:hypothetical protein
VKELLFTVIDHNVCIVRQTEIHTVEPLMPGSSRAEVDLDSFPIHSGLEQGNSLSPLLLTLL